MTAGLRRGGGGGPVGRGLRAVREPRMRPRREFWPAAAARGKIQRSLAPPKGPANTRPPFHGGHPLPRGRGGNARNRAAGGTGGGARPATDHPRTPHAVRKPVGNISRIRPGGGGRTGLPVGMSPPRQEDRMFSAKRRRLFPGWPQSRTFVPSSETRQFEVEVRAAPHGRPEGWAGGGGAREGRGILLLGASRKGNRQPAAADRLSSVGSRGCASKSHSSYIPRVRTWGIAPENCSSAD